jgi:hypothetical protein
MNDLIVLYVCNGYLSDRSQCYNLSLRRKTLRFEDKGQSGSSNRYQRVVHSSCP